MTDPIISKPAIDGGPVGKRKTPPVLRPDPKVDRPRPDPKAPPGPPATGDGPAPAQPDGRDPNAPFGDVFSGLFTPADPIVVPTPYPSVGGGGGAVVPILAVAGVAGLGWWAWKRYGRGAS